jgi:hypothetical protein
MSSIDERYDKLELLVLAQEKLNECIEILEEAVGDNPNVVAYLIDQLKTHATADHGFLCDNLTIDKVIENYSSDDSEDY